MKSYVILSIYGKRSKAVLEDILNKKINIIYIKYIKDEVIIKVSYDDYRKIRTSSYIKVLSYAGKKKICETYNKYKISILSFFIGALLFVFLALHTFYINIDTNNNELKEEIRNNLKNHNVTVFSLKKSFKELNKIKEKIKKENDNIEWLEFSYDGIVLNVKVIEKKRKYNEKIIDRNPTDIIAKKSGYIRKIAVTSGNILKNTDDYVNKGEVIISGNIIKNDEIIARTKSKGLVYAEVWYIKKLTKDLNYVKLQKSDYSKRKVILKINNKYINLVNLKVKEEKNKEKTLFQNKLFSLIIKSEIVYKKTNAKYTDEEAILILKNKAKNDIMKTLDKTEYITSQKTLKKYKENDRILIEVLFKVYEEIGQVVKSKENIEKEE